MPIRDFLFDIAKIIEGAVGADLDKVNSYSNQLCDRLEVEGEHEGARRIRKILSSKSVKTVGLSRANDNRGSSPAWHLPVDSESRLPTADESTHPIGSVDFFVSDRIRREIDQFLTFFRASDALVANGVGLSPTMLLFGPPGCGKTQLAKYIASELELPLITARVDGLISSYLGSTSKNIRTLFDYVASRPCIFFLDEFDALAKMRDDDREMGELKRVVIGLLQNIDALGKDHVLIAATNHEHLLDAAIWRRFACKIKLEAPDEATRRVMIGKFLHQFAEPGLVDILTWLGEGMTGAQLRHAAEDCIRDSVIKSMTHVEIRSAVERVLAVKCRFDSGAATLSDYVRETRRANPKRFSQAKLSKIFGISQATASRLLKGEG